MSPKYHAPEEETLGGEALQSLQLRKLRAMLAEILPANSFYQRKLGGLKPGDIKSIEDLRRLPFTTKAEIVADQAENPLFGTNLTYPLHRYSRMHQSSGTTGGNVLRWLDTPESWDWILRCWGIIYRAVGIRPEDRLFFAFSFGPFLGFWAGFEGATRLGNLTVSGGGMTSAARLRAIVENQVTVVGCTPTYALRLAEIAVDERIDLAQSPVRAVIVAGEPGGNIPETKERIQKAWGARCFDHTGMTEIGSLGIECLEDPGNTHLIGSECVYEVIDPQTAALLPPGQPGELVLTNLGRLGSPLIRYRTGDLVRLADERCACGRGFARMLGGILGRTDDMLIIRGNNIYPSAIEGLIRRFPEIAEFRIEVTEVAQMPTLRLEIEPIPAAQADVALAAKIGKAFQDVFHFHAEVRSVPPDTLPRFEMKSRRVVR